MNHLTGGAIKRILSGERDLNPILQILEINEIGAEPNRFSVKISDGVHYSNSAFLTTALTPALFNERKIAYSIVKVTKYFTGFIKNHENKEKPVMVLLLLEVLKGGSEVEKVIGNPTYYVHSEPLHHNANERPAVQPEAQRPLVPPLASLMESAGNPCISHISSSNKCISDSLSLKKVFPIECISPYQKNWPIKVRVTYKTPIKSWKNARGEGVLFNVELIDKTGEIMATAFKEQVDKFYSVLQEGELFYISHCHVVMADKKFCSHVYELYFTSETEVILCKEEDSSIPKHRFNFRPLEFISQAAPGSLLDIIGVCKSAGEVVTLRAKVNKELKKRDVTLVDTSLTAVTLTLWNKQAEEFVGDSSPVVAVKGGKVTEFRGGKSISASTLNINPDIPETYNLKSWFDVLPQHTKFNYISTMIDPAEKIYLLSEAIEAKLGCGETADYFSAYCTVLYVKTERWFYKACPTPECLKKVIEQNTGLYRCEKCNREYDSFSNRLLLSVNIADFTDHQWITIFHDVAEELLGVKADDLCRWNEENNAQFCNVFKNINLHTFLFKFRAKLETFNGESRLKLTAISVKKPNYKDRCCFLISKIKELPGWNTI